MATVFLFRFVGVAGALIMAAVTGRKYVDASCGTGAILVVAAIEFSAGNRNILVLIMPVKRHILAHFHQETAAAVGNAVSVGRAAGTLRIALSVTYMHHCRIAKSITVMHTFFGVTFYIASHKSITLFL